MAIRGERIWWRVFLLACVASLIAALLACSAQPEEEDEDDLESLGPFSVRDVSVDEGETAHFVVSLTSDTTSPVTFTYSTANGSASSSIDYIASSGSLSFGAGLSRFTINVYTIDNFIVDPSRDFSVTIDSPELAYGLTVTGHIENNEPTPFLNIYDSPNAVEGTNQYFLVSLSVAVPFNVSFIWYTQNGTATAGGDFTGFNGIPEVITAGARTLAVMVPTFDDGAIELTEYFVVSISGITGALGVDTWADTYLSDNDSPSTPNLYINNAIDVTEGINQNFVVSLSNTPLLNVTFQWSTVNGSASGGSDFTAVSNRLATIPAGIGSITLRVSTINDGSVEGTETYNVRLSNFNNAIGVVTQASGNLLDDDTLSLFVANGVNATEGTVQNFVVSINAVSGVDVTFLWSTVEGTASDGYDFTGLSNDFAVITAGFKAVTLSVNTLDDSEDEILENYSITVNSVSNAAGVDLYGVNSIVDDEVPALYVFDADPVIEGNLSTFTVTLDMIPASNVTFRWSTLFYGTASSGVDYTGVNNRLVTIPAGQDYQTLSVYTIDDVTTESTEDYLVTIFGITNATGTTVFGTGYIDDDD